jgi:uncharacterized protein YprB with RNaseH-like and TPR domain
LHQATHTGRWLLDNFPNATWETPGDSHALLTHRLRLPHADAVLPADHLFVDIETLGFVGRPIFLIGMLRGHDGPDGTLIQILARDYSEEEEALRHFVERQAAAAAWVTFNGKSFDLPSVRLRCTYHRLAGPKPPAHLDLLHVARRHFRGLFPDCRLKTLEQRVCGRSRDRDLDGSRVPDAYHRFVRDGDPMWLESILRHNRDDLVTLAELFVALREEDERTATKEAGADPAAATLAEGGSGAASSPRAPLLDLLSEIPDDGTLEPPLEPGTE